MEEKKSIVDSTGLLFKKIFIFVLVVLLAVLLGGTGTGAFIQFFSGEVGDDYAEVFGENVSGSYFEATMDSLCYRSRNQGKAVQFQCADYWIQNLKENAYKADQLGLDFSEQYVLIQLKKSIENQMRSYRKTSEAYSVMDEEEFQEEVARVFENQLITSPLEFRKDFMAMDPQMSFSPRVGNVTNPTVQSVLTMNSFAPDDDWKSFELGQKRRMSFQIVKVNRSELEKKYKKNIKITDAEVKAEFEKEQKAAAAKKKKDEKKDGPQPPAKSEKKKLTLTEKTRIRNKLKNQRVNKKIQNIMKQARELAQKGGTLKQVANITGNPVYTVKDLALWDAGDFASEETKPKREKFKLGQNEAFGKLFFQGESGKLLGPLKQGGSDHYLVITDRTDEGMVNSEFGSTASEIALPGERLLAERGEFALENRVMAKLASYDKIVKEKAEYENLRPRPKAAKKAGSGNSIPLNLGQ